MNTLIEVYFTNFPYLLYKNSNRSGNIAYVNVALTFIQSQKIFWTANTILCVLYFNRLLNTYFLLKTPFLLNTYIEYFLLLFCSYLYILSLIKIYNIKRFLG
jgi:hypothetical protein